LAFGRPTTGLGRYGIDDERLQTCRIIGIAANEFPGEDARVGAAIVLFGISSAPFAATSLRALALRASSPLKNKAAANTISLPNLVPQTRKVQTAQQKSAKN